jgi:hypothetical protein
MVMGSFRERERKPQPAENHLLKNVKDNGKGKETTTTGGKDHLLKM